MAERLTGKTALVTGAAQGSGGRSRCGSCARARAWHSPTATPMPAPRPSTDSATRPARVVMDISDEASVVAAMAALAADGWSPDVVVANAGVQLFGQDAKVADLDLAVWQRTIDVNLTGTFLTREARRARDARAWRRVDHPHRQPDGRARRGRRLHGLQRLEGRHARARTHGRGGLRRATASGSTP